MLGDSVIVSPTEPVGNDRRKVWFRKGNNLLDKSKFIFNKSLNVDTGTVNVSTSGNWYAIEEYIDFKQYAGKTISLSSRLTVAFYDSNKKYISSIVARINPTGIVPTNAVYIRADVYKDYYDVVQLEIGNTPTEYQPYVEPQIFIKNSNGLYEEFIRKEDVDYKPGEELIIPEGVMMTGNLTSNSSEIQCVFMTSKSLKNITNISIEDCLVVLRGINGYLDGSSTGIQLKGVSNYTINTKIRNNAIIFSFVRTTQFNTTNNTPVVVYPISFKVILQ